MNQTICPHDGKLCTATDRVMCGIGCTHGPIEHVTESDDREEMSNLVINEAAIAREMFSGSRRFDDDEDEENNEGRFQ